MSDFRTRAAAVASIQAKKAIALLNRTDDDFLHMPWADLDDIVAGMAEGDVWFAGGFSGDGKTTMFTSALDRWYEQGKRIYYLGLESRPKVLLTHWACKRLNVDAGDVLSGLSLKWHNWPHVRSELTAMINSLQESQTVAQVHFSPVEFVDGPILDEAMQNAKDFGADLFMVDHIDHVDGDGASPYEVSVDVNKRLFRNAQRLGLRCFVATQFNNDAIKGNRIARYLPPQPNYVFMGGHKRHIAAGMIGQYRPLRADLSADMLKRFQKGMLEPSEVLEPNTMAMVCMKHRLRGSMEGRRAFFGVERGKVVDINERDVPNYHGINTRGVM